MVKKKKAWESPLRTSHITHHNIKIQKGNFHGLSNYKSKATIILAKKSLSFQI